MFAETRVREVPLRNAAAVVVAKGAWEAKEDVDCCEVLRWEQALVIRTLNWPL